MMAISLRDLKHYDESIRYFLKYLSEKEGKKMGMLGATMELPLKPRRNCWIIMFLGGTRFPVILA